MRVTTYNLLRSSCSASPSDYEVQAGGHPFNLWSLRLPSIKAILQNADSDIFLLQEVTEQMLSDIARDNPHMKEYAFEITRGNRDSLECAICYKISRFRLVQRIEYRFRALTLILSSNNGTDTIAITTCHLKAGEDLHNDVIRERQARTIVQTMASVGALRQIIGGDLNSDRNLWRYYTRSPQALGVFERDQFISNDDTLPTFYGWERLKLDYIFAKHIQFDLSNEASTLVAPGPNKNSPSDHAALTASFNL